MRISEAIPPWMVAPLESWKEVIELLEKQALAIEGQLKATAPVPELLFGEGELTHELLGRELIDPHRFKTPARWATTLDFVRARARAMSDDVWVRSPSTAIRGCVA